MHISAANQSRTLSIQPIRAASLKSVTGLKRLLSVMLSKRLKKEAAEAAAQNEADPTIQLYCCPTNIHRYKWQTNHYAKYYINSLLLRMLGLIIHIICYNSWFAVIKAPEGSYYEGYSFKLSIDVGTDYPLTPPVFKFKTKIFHPNVLMDSGEICLDILKKEWSPAWSIQSACRAIIALLSDPAPDSPLNCDAGNMLRENDKIGFASVVKMYCVEFCVEA